MIDENLINYSDELKKHEKKHKYLKKIFIKGYELNCSEENALKNDQTHRVWLNKKDYIELNIKDDFIKTEVNPPLFLATLLLFDTINSMLHGSLLLKIKLNDEDESINDFDSQKIDDLLFKYENHDKIYFDFKVVERPDSIKPSQILLWFESPFFEQNYLLNLEMSRII